MRVTQSMMTNSSLRYLSQSYNNLNNLQDQLSSGKKISRASQDPVIAMNGMRYRTQETEVGQFKRNLSEVYNWMDNADATLDKTTSTLQRIRELTTQVSNDTYESSQRGNVAKEITQLREHLQSLANTKSNNKYMFNGTNTTNAPVDEAGLDVGVEVLRDEIGTGNLTSDDYDITYSGSRYELVEETADGFVFQSADNADKKITVSADAVTFNDESVEDSTKELEERQIVVSDKDAVSTNSQDVEIELLKGVNVAVNINPGKVFSTDFFGDIIRLEKALEDPSTSAEELSSFIDNFDKQINKVVDGRAELGARYNRVEMIDERVQEQEVIAKRILSDNEDADVEQVITELLAAENVHRASLSTMGRIMQPTLMDFLR